MATLTIERRPGGLYLPGLRLWLDAQRPQKGPDRAFVSHAHSDHTAAHREVILSAATARLMRARIAGDRQEHQLAFGETRGFETEPVSGESGAAHRRWQLTLLPAGHILGSAMALIEWGGESLLYTGDFRLQPGLAVEVCDPTPAEGCDVLVMETTFGRPMYRFPPAEAVVAELIVFARAAIAQGAVPVLLGYALGKSQELLHALSDANLPIALHAQVHKFAALYEQLGQKFPPYELMDPKALGGKLLICPPGALGRLALPESIKLRTAVATGWACDPGCRFRYGVDAAFPLSDHADFADLIALVRRIRPQRVLTCHGFAADFAQTLRELGFDARALVPEEQLWLPLEVGSASTNAPVRPNGA